MAEAYDTIGHGYGALRREDPRIAAHILRALAGASSVVNVGAGTGSYEPRGLALVAVEPSRVMLRQRARDTAPAVRGVASHLPFPADAFDASLAILTIHHWPDLAAGLGELRRVARDRVVVLTADPGCEGFWLLDYFPAIAELDRTWMPRLDAFDAHLGPCEIAPIAVPHDCIDGFLGAYWRRPHEYLDAERRKAISAFTEIGDLRPGLDALRRDLESGEWRRRYGDLLERDSLDIGYRLVVARCT